MYKSVIFDLGGVVFPSPFEAFDAYDDAHGLEPGSVRALIKVSSETGAWAALERGELAMDDFYAEVGAGGPPRSRSRSVIGPVDAATGSAESVPYSLNTCAVRPTFPERPREPPSTKPTNQRVSGGAAGANRRATSAGDAVEGDRRGAVDGVDQ